MSVTRMHTGTSLEVQKEPAVREQEFLSTGLLHQMLEELGFKNLQGHRPPHTSKQGRKALTAQRECWASTHLH